MNTLVSALVEDSYTYLTFVSEAAVAAFVFHGIQAMVAMYAITVIDTYSNRVVTFLQNFGLDLSAIVAQLKNLLTILGIFLALETAQDAMNWSFATFADSISTNPVIQYIGYATTIVDGLLLMIA